MPRKISKLEYLLKLSLCEQNGMLDLVETSIFIFLLTELPPEMTGIWHETPMTE